MSFRKAIKDLMQRQPEIIKRSVAEGVGMVTVLWVLNKTGVIETETQQEKTFKEIHPMPKAPQQGSDAVIQHRDADQRQTTDSEFHVDGTDSAI